ncbi:MAG: PH domain-containing protein [Thermoplasmata archaeon]
MASSTPTGSRPRLLKATYLADREVLLEETRATALFYLPGPVFWLIVLAALDYAAYAVRDSTLPAFPYLTNLFAKAPTISGYGPGTYLLVLFLVLTLIGFLRLVYRYLLWIRTVYAVTSHRVIIQKGILGRNFDEIPIPQVRGIDVHQTILQRILHYGTVRISSEGGTRVGNEDWVGIPRPFQFQRVIESANQNLTASVGQGPTSYPQQTRQ